MSRVVGYRVRSSGVGHLQLGVPEGLHHLVGGEGAGAVPVAAGDLVLGGKAEGGSKVVFGPGAGDIDGLLVLDVTAK